MNQAFGGAFLIKIALVFLCIYIFILGFAMNYARVFTMKNKIITLIEQYEGYDEGNTKLMNDIMEQKFKLNYNGLIDKEVSDGECMNTQNRTLYCIKRKTASHNMVYYEITTYIKYDIPVIKVLVDIPVTGETRYLYNF